MDGVADCPLTDREVTVLRLTAAGSPPREVAASLHLSYGTVRNYLASAVNEARRPQPRRHHPDRHRRGMALASLRAALSTSSCIVHTRPGAMTTPIRASDTDGPRHADASI